jgi:hypothetical protein
MSRIAFWTLLGTFGIAMFMLAVACPGAPPPKLPNFDTDVAPLFVRHCIDCHSGPKPKAGLDLTRRNGVLGPRKRGRIVIAGKPDDSPLWQRVRDDEMPPKKTLPEADKAVLRSWIASGGTWGTDPIDPFRTTTDRRAGYDWWSLRPFRTVLPPDVKETAWVRNPIDSFILHRLEAKGLAPSPEADRRTQLRRVSFDLIGLPPTPEEVAAFVGDSDPLAYEKVVDRLLASPHYGERWGRHWLDVVRYGESDGFERNFPRPNAWHFRDWVIRALNADMAYDEFCRLQIAGDVLAPHDADAVRATGFLVAGIHNTVVGGSKEMQENARQDELEEVVGTFGQTFLGLTVNCGRCHDHKFDPIPQRDYYSLAAALAGAGHGERDLPAGSAARQLAIRTAMKMVTRELESIEAPIRLAILAERGKEATVPPPAPIAAWDFRSGYRDQVGQMHGDPSGRVRRTADGAAFDGKTLVRTAPLARDLREKTLEAWVSLDNLRQAGGGAISVQTPDGNVFDAIVFGEREAGRWMAGSDGFRRTQSFNGPVETESDRRAIHFAIAYHADGTIAGYREGKPYGKPYRSDGPVLFKAGATVVLFGCRHEPVGGNKMLSGVVVKARLHDRALSPQEVAASFAAGGEYVSAEELSARLRPETRARWSEVRTRLRRLQDDEAQLQRRLGVKAYVVQSGQPPLTHVLVRGQISDPGELVSPAGLRAVPSGKAGLGLPPDAPEPQRRLRLAEWLTRKDNALFSRVMVNRLWHYHFGTGIVETPSDLGFNGGRPSHPELLEWLAKEFADGGFRLKEMHRLIVTSATYREAAAPRSEPLALDADCRLLWRKKPLRLEGEVLRDSMLATAGLLNSEVGGKGFSDYRTYENSGTTYYEPIDQIGADFQRRSLYRFTPRGANQGLLDSFDCPDPAAAAPRRSVTTTPLQALSLWNNAFALRMADALAGRVERDVPGNGAAILDGRVIRAFQLAFQRPPRPPELAAARRLVEAHGLPALCRTLLNANEFLLVE